MNEGDPCTAVKPCRLETDRARVGVSAEMVPDTGRYFGTAPPPEWMSAPSWRPSEAVLFTRTLTDVAGRLLDTGVRLRLVEKVPLFRLISNPSGALTVTVPDRLKPEIE